VLHEKDFERHFMPLQYLILPEQPCDGIRQFPEEIVEGRIFEREPGDVRRSDEPDTRFPIATDNYLIFCMTSLAGRTRFMHFEVLRARHDI
jgi:hypothetical protein